MVIYVSKRDGIMDHLSNLFYKQLLSLGYRNNSNPKHLEERAKL